MRYKSILFFVCIFLGCTNAGQAQFGKYSYDTSKFTFIEPGAQFNTLEDVLTLPQFKGKVTYIDIWGYGCAVCMKEFNYLPTIKNRYKNKNVAYLYVFYKGQDKEPDDFISNWVNYSIKHNLTGTHALAFIIPPQKIKNDHIISLRERKNYDTIYLDSTEYAIPRYMLADKSGKIVDYKAPRPSERETLIKKIDAILNDD